MNLRSKTFRFTHRALEAFPTPTSDEVSSNIEVTDSVESGLKMAIYLSGKRSFRHRYVYRGVKKSMTLGEFPAVNVERARERVRENKALLAEDLDPQNERQEKINAITFETYARDHFIPYAKQTRRSFKDIKSRINLRILPTFGSFQLASISKPAIAKFHLKIRDEVSATSANRYLALISSMFQRAIEIGLTTENPARGISKFREKGARKRVLSGDEMTRFMTALKPVMDSPQGKAIFLLLATGLRKSELLSIKWSHIDWTNQCVNIPETKSGRPHNAVLNSKAYEVLKQMELERDPNNAWVFPSDSVKGHLLDIRRTFKTVMTKAGISNLTIHDMRRSFASILINKGVPISEIRDLLNHADIRTTQVYAHLNKTSLRQASERAAQELGKFIQ